MRGQRIATATMVVLAVGGWAALGSGTAFAEVGPDGARVKARATGGSSTGGAVFQQNVAQSARQNNNCNNPNMQDEEISLTDSRATGRCVTSDGSFTAFSRIQAGRAEAEGGSSTASLVQQNTAQRGGQNNNCNNPNETEISLEGGRAEDRCTDQDFSFSRHTLIRSGGARAEGGSGTVETVSQQNIAQEGRQNNNCNNPNFTDNIEVTGGRTENRCHNRDHSFSKHTLIKGGGARAEGGSGTEASVSQQSIAQEGRQNNACNNPNDNSGIPVAGSRVGCGNKDGSFSKHTLIKGGGARTEGGSSTVAGVSHMDIAQEGRQNNVCANPNRSGLFELSESRTQDRCHNRDHSLSKHTLIKGGGARAEGGSSTGGNVRQQNIAQEGRQNNSCANLGNSGNIEVTGGRTEDRCLNRDLSFSKHTLVKGGGARAEGGSSTADTVSQQNVAQEGRQNNNCANPNASGSINVTGGRTEDRCLNRDLSFSKHTLVKGGGARAEGGSSTVDTVQQQNLAQEGRQNNNCADPNSSGDIEVTGGGRTQVQCLNRDHSFSKHTLIKGGGARAEGGSSTGGEVEQQNIAQEGRQNNNCNNLNDTEFIVTGGRTVGRCGNQDISFNKHALAKGGGARAESGSSTGGSVFQQNVAQEGRQNTSCNNHNSGDFGLTGTRYEVGCKTVDGSANVHTADIGGGAKAEGGSATADLFQQNIAQEGRQNNNCGNTNNLTFTATDSRTQAHCVAVDRSTNIGTVNR
ncbi:hypothetical protein [Streptomyces sp. NPDC051776]|uniref:hypothetical protein n=1 Tax=Streptomyces sp. NPDC051776 TaxID=3155414 RepID=UPI0034325DDF